jgi:hypothetical protein
VNGIPLRLLADLANYFVHSLSGITARDMVETALPSRLVLSMVVIVLCASSSAEARRWRRYYSQPYIDQSVVNDRNRNADRESSIPSARPFRSQGPAFGATVEQLIRGCNQEAIELKNWPFDSLAQIVGPDENQRNALQQMQDTAVKTADILASTCPKEIPAPLTARFDALKHGLEAFIAALDGVRPVIETFYTSLNDEQKARLVAMYMSNNNSREKSDQSRRSSRNGQTYRDASSTQQESICGKWAGALRDWPTRQIESNMTLSDTQHAALYDLTASTYRAAGTLIASCPTETSFTPLGQIEAKRKRVDALGQATSMIRPFLDRFTDTLNDEQKIRLTKIVNPTQITVPRRRNNDDD